MTASGLVTVHFSDIMHNHEASRPSLQKQGRYFVKWWEQKYQLLECDSLFGPLDDDSGQLQRPGLYLSSAIDDRFDIDYLHLEWRVPIREHPLSNDC